MITFPLDTLKAMDPLGRLKPTKRIAAHMSFFKSGICIGQMFVCIVKTSPLLSTIKIFEPINQMFWKLLQAGTTLYRSTRSSTSLCS